MRNSNTAKKAGKSPSHTLAKTSPSRRSKASASKPALNGRQADDDLRTYWSAIMFDGRSWGVVFEDFPGCVSAGDSFEEAAAGAYEALGMHVRAMLADGDHVPSPSDIKRVQRQYKAAKGERVHFVPIAVHVAGNLPVKVTLSLQQELLGQLDVWARTHNETRNDMIETAVKQRMLVARREGLL